MKTGYPRGIRRSIPPPRNPGHGCQPRIAGVRRCADEGHRHPHGRRRYVVAEAGEQKLRREGGVSGTAIPRRGEVGERPGLFAQHVDSFAPADAKGREGRAPREWQEMPREPASAWMTRQVFCSRGACRRCCSSSRNELAGLCPRRKGTTPGSSRGRRAARDRGRCELRDGPAEEAGAVPAGASGRRRRPAGRARDRRSRDAPATRGSRSSSGPDDDLDVLRTRELEMAVLRSVALPLPRPSGVAAKLLGLDQACRFPEVLRNRPSRPGAREAY